MGFLRDKIGRALERGGDQEREHERSDCPKCIFHEQIKRTEHERDICDIDKYGSSLFHSGRGHFLHLFFQPFFFLRPMTKQHNLLYILYYFILKLNEFEKYFIKM